MVSHARDGTPGSHSRVYGGETIRALVPRLAAAVFIGVLTGCASDPVGGPAAPRGAADAGTLTLASGRSYRIYPHELVYTGTGSYRWPDGRTYQGTFLDGLPGGIGTGTWADGDRYRGTWHQGLMHGHGELTRADGSRYRGDFVAGAREGDGVEQSEDGLYNGGWENDLPNGQGRFHDTGGALYDGGWVDGRRQGRGTYTDSQGSIYDGDWFDDVPDGFGALSHADGSGYEGEWQSGIQQGYGTSVSIAGAVYEGTWIGGQRQGFGEVRRPDGSRYQGEWVEGRRQGQGRESYADGSFHEGTWVADQPHGPGRRRDRTGIEISGVWSGDSVREGRMRLPTGAEYSGPLLRRRNTVVDAGLLAWLDERAAAGDPYARFFLGTAYTDFQDPAPDPFTATGHFRAAARAGIPDAEFRLALLLLDRTPDQAVVWLKAAAAQGQAQANALLGEYYLTGNRVPLDVSRAIACLEVGSDAGDMTARNNLAWVLATTEAPGLRDGERALALIRPLALMRGGWQHLDTLAAAYAAVSRYADAAEAQAQAIADAEGILGAGSSEVMAMQDRLESYRARAGNAGGR
ncbi:MAG: hypothetical protein AB7I04_03370 [Pseudomonadales bacterium]